VPQLAHNHTTRPHRTGQEDRALLAEREHRARVLRMQADKRKLDAGYTLAPADTGDGAEGKGDGGEPAVKVIEFTGSLARTLFTASHRRLSDQVVE
jgi:hypothetical protein